MLIKTIVEHGCKTGISQLMPAIIEKGVIAAQRIGELRRDIAGIHQGKAIGKTTAGVVPKANDGRCGKGCVQSGVERPVTIAPKEDAPQIGVVSDGATRGQGRQGELERILILADRGVRRHRNGIYHPSFGHKIYDFLRTGLQCAED